MNTREIAAEYRLAHWAKIMHQKSQSGLTTKAFCAREGFHPNNYYYWQRKLREAASEEFQSQYSKTYPTPSGFTELKIASKDEQLPTQENISQGEIHIEIAGIRISANSTYPAEKIATLLSLCQKLC